MFYIIIPKMFSNLGNGYGRYLTAETATEAVRIIEQKCFGTQIRPEDVTILNAHIDDAVLDINGLRAIAEEEA